MTGQVLAAASGGMGTGEAITFWILGPIALGGAIGMVLARNAVHSALFLVLTMFSLGVFYVLQGGPFIGMVQIIVYTGAIMILFLFVLMLVGRDSSDSVVETLRGQRLTATVLGIGFAGLVGAAIVRGVGTVQSVGLEQVNADGNVTAIALRLFSDYVFAFEVTSALLITAAVGAMVLAHRERLDPKPTQASLAAQRLRDYTDKGLHPGPLPPPGVFARHNAVDTPALLPDGTTAEASISRVLRARGTVRSAPALADDIQGVQRGLEGRTTSYRDDAVGDTAPDTGSDTGPDIGPEPATNPEGDRR
jgi:NADH-quinone oxidoreductase subunit J